MVINIIINSVLIAAVLAAPPESSPTAAARANTLGGSSNAGTSICPSFYAPQSPKPILDSHHPHTHLGASPVTYYRAGALGAYYMEVGIGTPPQLFQLFIDTGSADIWVNANPCENDVCRSKPRLFYPEMSSSFTLDGQSWEIEYADSSFAKGFQAIDNLSIGNLNIKQQKVALATSISGDYITEPIDGLLGLGFRSETVNGIVPFIETLISDAPNCSHKFAVYLPKNRQNPEITFGHLNDKLYRGEITYTPIVPGDHTWQLRLDDILFDGKSLDGKEIIVIDTGSALTSIDAALVNQIHADIPGAQYIENDGWYIPCDNEVPAVSFVFSGRQFSIPKGSLQTIRKLKSDPGLCYSGIQGTDGIWILGLSWFDYWYVVFDPDRKMIGIAELVSS
ncbi:acid protease [Basidiobolus meristosporus CBS 931.73]|uniref:Acid protease n=1 Tax=Basidiobolus meristosporus CBS 931.73 TaxID=1314790 RepID=A0A1Y1XRK8_9FUNG|nr:acid protease [Basidiobolus meristosporus CBS 931.73]|eukprot:ORX88367.1 acid protease [Basidiobolus meristosporus CBS 931.73]